MQSFLTELFEYSHHFNHKLWNVFDESPDHTSKKAVKLYNHIINAHHIWNSRIEKKVLVFGVWEIHALQELKSIDAANYEKTVHIIDHAVLSATIHYSNSRGEEFSNSVRDMLFHIVNYSTYHRGQIASEFRNHGLDPLITDYIFYKR